MSYENQFYSFTSLKDLNENLDEIKKLKSEIELLKLSVSQLKYQNDTNFWHHMKNCSLHGIQDLYESKDFLSKLVWILILISAIVCSCIGCYSVTKQFFDSPVYVSYTVKEMGDNWILPDVVVCPFNRFNKTYFQEFKVSAGLAQYLELTYPSMTVYRFQNDDYQIMLKSLDEYQHELESLLEKLGNLSFDAFINQSMIRCEAFFQDEVCKNAMEIKSATGRCFRIPGKIQPSSGFGSGLRLRINLPKHLYHPSVNQMPNDGIAVKLVAPKRGIDDDLTFIPSGVHAIMPLKSTKFEFKNDSKWYNCNEDINKTYSRTWCYDSCYVEPAELACNCSLVATSFRRYQKICTAKQYYGCFLPALVPNIENRLKECKKTCRRRCKYWQFDKTISYVNFPADEYKIFSSSYEEWENLKNTIILDIYYESLDYILIKHESVLTLSNILAQIGGQFSLWIGGSIISIIQIFIYFCCGTLSAAKKQTKKNSRSLKNEEESHNMIKF